MNIETTKNAKREGEKLRNWKYENYIVRKYLWHSFRRFMELLEKMSTIMKLRFATCWVSLEESWSNLEGSWYGRILW